ncbi:MAG: signal recognition particle-docking protein FtsY, partial [Phycicoccus sp.]
MADRPDDARPPRAADVSTPADPTPADPAPTAQAPTDSAPPVMAPTGSAPTDPEVRVVRVTEELWR